jgi:hypothetical protein
MKGEDILLRRLGRQFAAFEQSRRDLREGGDEASRAENDRAWADTIHQIIALKASTRHSMHVKARVVEALIEAGETAMALDAARSLAADIHGPFWRPS